MKKLVLALAVGAVTISSVQAKTPSVDEMWRIIQSQQAEIEALKDAAAARDNRLSVTVERLDMTADVVDQVSSDNKVAAKSKTTLGGYGELHYNNLEKQSDGSKKEEIDFHRFVLFVNHEFNDTTRLFSELELEHSIAGDGKPGEIELEQAYIEHDYAANHQFKAGLFLIPVGIMNETHEPNTFYGVERNPVEKNIIPTTWWEGGAALTGRFGEGFSYDAALTSGL
ncbi:MAG: hypothetical protein V7711_01995, partial [Pseudomonadales bacterium]